MGGKQVMLGLEDEAVVDRQRKGGDGGVTIH